jgi:hypothetical protein
MRDTIRCYLILLMMATAATVCFGPAATAQEPVWRIANSSGEAFLMTSKGQRSMLTEGVIMKFGDTVRTGRAGRVLLRRGEETILISSNSVIGIPAEKNMGFPTTIIQQAGSILLEVQKRNVQHFSVETPFLTAIVKGTQFRVTVNQSDARVDVFRGQVEVQDLKSGQYAMVLPNQSAMVSAREESEGLFLSGSGLSAIYQGTPRSPSVSPAIADEGHLIARAQNGQPVRMASAHLTMGAGAWIPLNSSSPPDWYSTLASYVMSFVKFKASGHGSRGEDSVLAIIVAGSVFFTVSLAVAIRQRKNRKGMDKLAA